MTKPRFTKEQLLARAGMELGEHYDLVLRLRENPAITNDLPAPEKLEAEVKALRDDGVKDDDQVSSYSFKKHPKVQEQKLQFAEAAAFAAEYRTLHRVYRIHYCLLAAENLLEFIRKGYLKPEEMSLGQCDDFERKTAAARTALADARVLDAAMKVGRQKQALDAFQTAVCDPLAAMLPEVVGKARAAEKARLEKVAAPFVAAGISGDKLALMVKYADVYWRLPGGEKTDNPKKLAAASLLFQWLEAEDRGDPRHVIHTIRRYEFKGNAKGPVTEAQHRLLKGARLDDSVFQ